MKVFLLVLFLGILASIYFLFRSNEPFQIELQYDLPWCDGHGHDTPEGSSVLIIRGYYYSHPPRLFTADGQEIVPYQFDSDEPHLTYYYTIPSPTNPIVVSTTEDIQPQVSINTGDSFMDFYVERIETQGCQPLPGNPQYYQGECRTGPFQGPYAWLLSPTRLATRTKL